jgi:hypothetical protein
MAAKLTHARYVTSKPPAHPELLQNTISVARTAGYAGMISTTVAPESWTPKESTDTGC